MTFSDLTVNGTVILGALLLAYAILVNVATYATFALDKQAAIERAWRIPEATLLTLALLGGTPGAKLAQRRLRHKTRKQPFRSLLNLIAILQIGGIVWLAGPWGPSLPALIDAVSVDLHPFADRPDPPAMPRRFGPGS